jgi:hypothetical protein
VSAFRKPTSVLGAPLLAAPLQTVLLPSRVLSAPLLSGTGKPAKLPLFLMESPGWGCCSPCFASKLQVTFQPA